MHKQRIWSQSQLSHSLATLPRPIRATNRRATSLTPKCSSDPSLAASSSTFGGETQSSPMQQPQSSLIRRQSLTPAVIPNQPPVVSMSQVMGKQVITRSSGRNLGLVTTMWVDASRGEVVSMDVEEKKGAVAAVANVGGGAQHGSLGTSNVQLARLVQIGDVLLVQDEQVLYDPPLDGRYGFLVIAGMEVRTRGGDFLGKVRDFSFSPDNGAITRLVYDDFGLSFLPSAFFDTFSVALGDVLGMGPGGIVVSDDAKYRERRESNGLFAALPSLFRSISGGGGGGGSGGIAGLLSAPSQDSSLLPQGYTYAQWEMDVRRWEQETGLSYDQYVRSGSSTSPHPQQQMLGSGSRGPSTSPSWQPQPPQTPQSQSRYNSPQPQGTLGSDGGLPAMGRPQQLQPQPLRSPQGYPQNQNPNPYPSSSSPPPPPGPMRRGPPSPQQQQWQQWQPSQGGGRGGGPQSVDPRYRGPASSPYYPPPPSSNSNPNQPPQPLTQPPPRSSPGRGQGQGQGQGQSQVRQGQGPERRAQGGGSSGSGGSSSSWANEGQGTPQPTSSRGEERSE